MAHEIETKVLDIKALKAKVKVLKEELSGLTMDKNINKLKDLKTISKKKKELAQTFTVLGQKQILENLELRSMNQEASEEKKGAAAV